MAAAEDDTDTEAALAAYKAERELADEERTPEEAAESLQWLRDRGVEVESVEVSFYRCVVDKMALCRRPVVLTADRTNQ
jgi:hypothetical protein